MNTMEASRPGEDQRTGQRIVLVTGPSGAGRSTSIHALEDLGYEVIDNLPISLIPRLLDGPPIARPLALGIDVRNRDFSVTALIEFIDRLTRLRSRFSTSTAAPRNWSVASTKRGAGTL